MIIRIWHGWTTLNDAEKYERLLKDEIFPMIAAKQVPGYLGIELLSARKDEEIEFITVMRFESLAAVKRFAGEDYTSSFVPESARKLLVRYDKRSQHYDLLEQREYQQ
ncbi:MAG TPA: hypothetical protein VHG33_02020 [Woeseiaceae bacterium]|nr:hypothetical protein [Woeseiaceae bacterium]